MSEIHRVVLVDDEEPARRMMRQYVSDHPRFRIVGEASTGTQAVDVLQQTRPDVTFLDVEMPGLDGFDVLRAIPSRRWPLVVFCTGHEEYAVQAFEMNAVDYLLKPIDEERAQRTLDRVALRLGEPDADQRARMERLLTTRQESQHLERIPIRKQGKVEIVELDEVEWIAAAGNYVELHLEGRRHLYRTPLSHLADRLDPRRFVRIHRSTVVNVERVRELEPTPQGDWKLRLDTGAQLRLSRRFREALDRLVPSRVDRGTAS